jgi:hypothetical protein
MLTKEKGKGTNTLHKSLNQTTTKSGPRNNNNTKEILTLKRKQAMHLLRQPTQDSKYPGIPYTKHLTKNRNYLQTGNTSVKITEVPYKFVYSGTHFDIK